MTKIKRAGAPVIAVDIGGTKILTALFSPDGKLTARETCPTLAAEGADKVVARLAAAIDNIMRQNNVPSSRLGGIGLACAGGIDSGRGVVVTPSPHLLGWFDIPLADIIREKFHVTTCLVNDASAAALGEHRSGAGRGVNNLVLITLGTGIGGGIIADGRLYLGAVGAAGEFGHMTIDDNGPACVCGNKGCWEMLASGTAIAADAIRRVLKGEKSILAEMAGGRVEGITAAMVGEASRQGDKIAADVIARAAYYLGVGLVNIVNIFNPEMIILGGGLAGLGDPLIGPARRLVAERGFAVSARAVRIVTAALGNEAGIYGAAAFTMDKIRGGQHEGT